MNTIEKLKPYRWIALSAMAVLFFGSVQHFIWEPKGSYELEILWHTFENNQLVWIWIGLIGVISATNFIADTKHPMWHVISAWWVGNITITEILEKESARGIGESFSTFLFSNNIPNVTLDFLAQGAFDLISLFILIYLVRKEWLNASFGVVAFGLFLLANLYGHAKGAHNVMECFSIGVCSNGVIPEIIPIWYDDYLSLVFSVMLLAQVFVSGADASLRGIGSNVDLYTDIRSVFRFSFDRYLHKS